ncbi:hypothetical protein DY000_02013551 [Brassica cretica]|uniref:ABC transmembrane type-1 domain-containing protein n=1 Tax=Brassica cretica TaxID=69181 RepID=A0ABQ7CN52_BRACR|nr:hypothetical protein DY000_02013551 [Brassica cretica]
MDICPKTQRSMNFRGNIPTKFSLGIFRGDFRQTSDPRNFLGNLFPQNSVGKFRGISEERRNSKELFPRTCFVVAVIPCIPLIVATGGAMALIMSKMAGRGQLAYAEAGNVVAFTREKQATQKYEKKLEIAYKSMVQQGLFSGLGLGIMMVVSYCTYGIAIWYGAWLIMEKGYIGGRWDRHYLLLTLSRLDKPQPRKCLRL